MQLFADWYTIFQIHAFHDLLPLVTQTFPHTEFNDIIWVFLYYKYFKGYKSLFQAYPGLCGFIDFLRALCKRVCVYFHNSFYYRNMGVYHFIIFHTWPSFIIIWYLCMFSCMTTFLPACTSLLSVLHYIDLV